VYSSLDKVRNVRRDEELATELIPGWSIPVAAIVPHEIDIPEDEYGLPS
jgi:hypothetical protein